jgi:hypothetical protein
VKDLAWRFNSASSWRIVAHHRSEYSGTKATQAAAQGRYGKKQLVNSKMRYCRQGPSVSIDSPRFSCKFIEPRRLYVTDFPRLFRRQSFRKGHRF